MSDDPVGDLIESRLEAMRLKALSPEQRKLVATIRALPEEGTGG